MAAGANPKHPSHGEWTARHKEGWLSFLFEGVIFSMATLAFMESMQLWVMEPQKGPFQRA
jgi:hypothetical protein